MSSHLIFTPWAMGGVGGCDGLLRALIKLYVSKGRGAFCTRSTLYGRHVGVHMVGVHHALHTPLALDPCLGSKSFVLIEYYRCAPFDGSKGAGGKAQRGEEAFACGWFVYPRGKPSPALNVRRVAYSPSRATALSCSLPPALTPGA
jgi:hypothetical protein